MKKVLITGGACFIGYHLANKLLGSNYQIDLLDNFQRGVNDSQLSSLINNVGINLVDADLLQSAIIDQLDHDQLDHGQLDHGQPSL